MSKEISHKPVHERWVFVFQSVIIATRDTIDARETRDFLIKRAMQYGRAWLVTEDEVERILSHTIDDTLNANNSNYLPLRKPF